MPIMHPLNTLSLLFVLSSSVFLALIFGSENADRETVPVTLKCGDIKDVTSPNYPDNYNNNLEIHWDVQADLAQRIVVTFNDFQTEDSDYLYLEEINYPSSEAKYSGIKAITPYISLGNHIDITFHSDRSESRRGFHLSLSCLTQTENNTDIHEAFEGSEHIRVLTQPVCRNPWHVDVSDTICREAGFPGAYETTWRNNTPGLNGTSYNCNSFTHRLRDCEIITSCCTRAYESVVINCNVLSQLGCFNLVEYTNLLSGSVKLSRDVCLTHCNSYSATPQYAVHHSGTNCSCINQTALDVTKLTTNRDLCRTNTKNPTGHWTTLFNVSFGFCSEPPKLDNGSWENTSNGFMYDTTVYAKCNDNYELVGEDRKMRCGKATTSTDQDFEWHGTIPSCRKRNNGPADEESLSVSVTSTLSSSKTTSKIKETSGSGTLRISSGVLTPVIIIISFACIITWKKMAPKRTRDGESPCSLAVGDIQQRDYRIIRFLRGVWGGTRPQSTESRSEDPEEKDPALQKIHRDSTQLLESFIQTQSLK